MPDYFEIYSKQAEQYEQLVTREDYQGNIFRTINEVVPLNGLRVVEFGAGTGRLTCTLAPVVRSIQAFDQSAHMLQVAVAKLRASGLHNWQVAVGDHRSVAAPSEGADLAISGWSVCYMVVGNTTNWQGDLLKALNEMRRVLRPGGALILLETLGTGYERPEPPANLLAYYEFLEASGFRRTWMRTDYQFRDMREAQTLTRFFFGDATVEKLRPGEHGVMLAECTGMWYFKP